MFNYLVLSLIWILQLEFMILNDFKDIMIHIPANFSNQVNCSEMNLKCLFLLWFDF